MIAPLLTAVAAAAVGLSAQQSLVEGPTESKVRVLIYEDLECPDCAAFRQMMDGALLPRYSGRVAFVHRDFPLSKHPWARKAAIAARYFAAIKPELGLAYRRYIMATIQQTRVDNFNERLSQNRANSVRDYLTSQGVNSSTITAQGFGPNDPVASNETASGRQQNRRVELVVSGASIGQATSTTPQ